MSFPDSNDAPVSQQSSARRRLLRGVVGAAVLPVGAGAQAAVASNLRCIANTVDPAAEPPSAAGGRSADKLAADNVTRVPLYKSTNTISGKLYVRYWVKGSDLVALKNTAVVGLPSGVTGANYLLSSSTYVATSSPWRTRSAPRASTPAPVPARVPCASLTLSARPRRRSRSA